MCGRYTLTREEREIAEKLEVQESFEFTPRFNIAPTQEVPVVFHDGGRTCTTFRWGLIPFWARETAIGSRLINARSETISVKPAFRNLLGKKRCLIPADGFYEWKKSGKQKIPVHIHLASREVFCFAGLWDCWRSPEGQEIRSFTIITTEANEGLRTVHDRMPVILRKSDYQMWLDPSESNKESLKALLRPYDSEEMQHFTVSPFVNSPRNEGAQCMAQTRDASEGELWELGSF